MKLYTRGGCDWSKRYPLIAEALARLRVSSVVLDREVMCFDDQGGHDFDALWDRTNDDEVRLDAFDIRAKRRGLPGKPLLERKKRLARLLKTPLWRTQK